MGTIRKYLALGVSLSLFGCGGELATPVANVKSQDSGAPDRVQYSSVPVPASVGVKKDPNVIVVDSENDTNWTEKDGSWDFGDGGGDHAGTTLWAYQGNGESRFRWRPRLPNAGRYRVSVWYGGDPNGDHASDAPFTVHYDGGIQTHKLDQTRDSGGWRVLGRYRFKAGTAGYVELTNSANGNVIADAVRFEREVIIVDSEDDVNRTERDGSWASGEGGGDHAETTLWAYQGNGESRFRWRPKLPNAGRYRVSVWYGGDPNGDHASDAPFTVHYAGGKQTHKLDQTRDSGGWRVLGSYRFKAGTAGYVELTNAANGNVIADAVRFDRAQDSGARAPASVGSNKGQKVIIVDSENDARWTEQDGTWTSGDGGGDHAGTTLWAFQGNGESRFRWRPKLPNAGRYRVSVWYGGDPNGDHASDAPFTVHYAGGKQTQKLDQTLGYGGWRVLGSYRFRVGTAGYVELTNAANGNVVADAVRFERLK